MGIIAQRVMVWVLPRFQTEGLLRIGNRVWAEDKVPVFLELAFQWMSHTVIDP